MILRQLLTAAPQGNIKSGTFQYTFDTESGTLSYRGVADLSILGHQQTNSVEKLPLNYLNSENYRMPGAVLKIGDLSFTVQALHDSFATCTVQYKKYKGSGVLDLKGEHVHVSWVHAAGSVMFYKFDLLLKDA